MGYDFNSYLPKRHFTLAQVIAMLAAIVNEFGYTHTPAPNGSNSGCKYSDTDANGFVSPVCIIGVWLHKVGILGPFAQVHNTDTCIAAGWSTLLNDLGVTLDDEALAFMRSVQSEQDSGKSWGDALLDTNRHYRRDALNKAREERDRVQAEAEAAWSEARNEAESVFSVSL